MKEGKEDEYFRNSRHGHIAWWHCLSNRSALGYANRSRKGRRCYGTVLGIIGVITAGFFWFLGVIKLCEIIWRG